MTDERFTLFLEIYVSGLVVLDIDSFFSDSTPNSNEYYVMDTEFVDQYYDFVKKLEKNLPLLRYLK